MPSKRLRVLLNFTHDPDQVVQETAGAVVAGLKGNDKFPTPPVDPATLQQKLTDFVAAISAAGQGGPFATAEKDKIREELVLMLRQLALYVQATCKDDMATLLSSGFLAASTTRTRSPLDKPVITSIDQGNSTQLFVTVKPVRNVRSYEVRYSPIRGDGTGESKIIGALTDSRSMPINGLVPGTTYIVQVRALGASANYSDWSDSVSRVCW